MAKQVLPKGFLVSGVYCGIKRFNKDLGLIYSPFACKAAGVFTKNKVKAAPVIVAKETLNKGKPIHAVVVNSGNANCCTGRYGTRDAKRMINAVAENLGLKAANVYVASTGIIGKRLPVVKIVDAIPKAVKQLSEKGLFSVAKSILTTDRKIKVETEKFQIGSKKVTICGICKGAGMIQPDMATMLCFIMTDAKIDKDALKVSLNKSVQSSFNSITIDGDMSTNDCVLVLANGQAHNKVIKKDTKEFDIFMKHLSMVSFELAKAIIKDGEGATKFVSVHVKGAKTDRDAQTVSSAVASSLLVKTSMHGQDANWGRIASSVGASMAESVKQNKMEIFLDGVCFFRKGKFASPQREKISKVYKKRNINILVNLNTGKKEAKTWTCDLSKKYVEINSHYMT